MAKRVVLITQARMGSSRLPAKVIKSINGITLMDSQLLRVKRCQKVDQIVVATPAGDEQKPIHEICKKNGVDYFEGSERNVLDRYYWAAKEHKADWVVRITSDCPLIDPKLIDEIIARVIAEDKDYGSNTLIESYPDGQDIEVFKFEVLEKARNKVILNSDKEHVTPFIKRNCDLNLGSEFSSISIVNEINYSEIRMTVDEKRDLDAIKLLVKNLGFEASWTDYTRFILDNHFQFLNQKILRNEGYLRSLQKD